MVARARVRALTADDVLGQDEFLRLLLAHGVGAQRERVDEFVAALHEELLGLAGDAHVLRTVLDELVHGRARHALVVFVGCGRVR